MSAGGNWWRANEIVIRHLTRRTARGATVAVTEPLLALPYALEVNF
jgi:hypothetical protein